MPVIKALITDIIIIYMNKMIIKQNDLIKFTKKLIDLTNNMFDDNRCQHLL